ncbi:SDR family oxidoreductase [Novispirillum itersonii]|uniref:NAD(P)-dependent dehydrogenase (Short-subunit alcohol dehydrogenase family) n=1 Tax=Novispirillum itersonii TaxID=189 RepID=A0A7W9ZHL6_NOVIT|nr:SDR family oxidoreductase [Novispirillum itersonii]MBB6211228.1 NAD(P)-dependent dehydrogenase (short-subunit alcohol dehydrogenase family) [Novispirillum itersonii]
MPTFPCTAIVTGHSRGLGAAITAALLERGIPVLALSRSGNPALTNHPLLTEVALDLGDAVAVGHWLETPDLAAFIGDTVPLLINNAGTVAPIGPLGTQDPLQVVQAVTLNVTAPLLLSNALVAARPSGSPARILHISSGAARNAYAGWAVYCATKAALDHHARAVQADACDGLRIASLAPGVIDTAMQATIRDTDRSLFPLLDRFTALKDSGSLSSPEDSAARLVDYLLSDRFGTEATPDLRAL